MQRAGRLVTRFTILDEVWDGDTDLRSNVIDVHVASLRAKIDTPVRARSDPDRARHRLPARPGRRMTADDARRWRRRRGAAGPAAAAGAAGGRLRRRDDRRAHRRRARSSTGGSQYALDQRLDADLVAEADALAPLRPARRHAAHRPARRAVPGVERATRCSTATAACCPPAPGSATAPLLDAGTVRRRAGRARSPPTSARCCRSASDPLRLLATPGAHRRAGRRAGRRRPPRPARRGAARAAGPARASPAWAPWWSPPWSANGWPRRRWRPSSATAARPRAIAGGAIGRAARRPRRTRRRGHPARPHPQRHARRAGASPSSGSGASSTTPATSCAPR